MSVENLPKDVGLCAACNAKNSKYASKCHNCGEVLPWAAGKGKAAPVAAAAPQVKTAKTISNPLSSLDIGGTLGFAALFLGVFVLSSMCFIVGIGLYRYFANKESPLRYAAGAAIALNILGLIARFTLAGSSAVDAVDR